MTKQELSTSSGSIRRSFWIDCSVVCAIFIITLVLYAPSMHYPFVWFDADDLARSVKYSPAEIFTGMPHYPYYRPLIFIFWKLILATWGPNSAPIFHSYSIGAHFLCAVLLYRFVRDLAHDRTIAAAAALLFTTYPFSYQAITWSTAQSHPTNLALVLVCAILYLRAREKDRGRSLYLAAALCLIVAMLIHENAYVGVMLVLATEAYLFLEHRVRRLSLWPVLYFILTLAVYAVYHSASKASPVEATLQPETGLYLLQGLIYPAALLITKACAMIGCESATWLLPVSGLIGLVLVFRWRSSRTLLLGIFGLIWFGLEIMPVWVGRDYIYVQYAPRLLYSAGAGVAISIAALLGKKPRSRLQLMAFGLVALIAFQSAQFVMARNPLHTDAFGFTEQANQALFSPRQGTAVFIDTPELYTYREQEFPLGWYGVMVAPWHNRLGVATDLRPDNADWLIDPAHAQQIQNRAQLKLDFHGQVLPPDQLQTAIISATQIYRMEISPGGLHLFKIGQIERSVTAPDSFTATWPGGLCLISETIELEAGVPVLNLDWQIGDAIDPNVTVFVHVRDANGQMVTQADGDLIGGYVPIGRWQKGDQVQERRPLFLADNLPAGQYTVVLGLYNRVSQERLTPTWTNGSIKDDALIIGQVDRP